MTDWGMIWSEGIKKQKKKKTAASRRFDKREGEFRTQTRKTGMCARINLEDDDLYVSEKSLK
jgi:hypothetical protein